VEIRPTKGDAQAFAIRFSGDKLQLDWTDDYKPVAELSMALSERTPKNGGEEALLNKLIWDYQLADLAIKAMVEAGWAVQARTGFGFRLSAKPAVAELDTVLNMAWVMCQACLQILRYEYVFSGVTAARSDLGVHPTNREIQAGLLSGWVAAKTNLNVNQRISAALAAGGKASAEALAEELPGAVTIAWGAGSEKEFLADVRRSIEGLAREAEIRPANVRDDAIEEAAAAFASDEDLAEFEREETLRLRRQQLDELEQVAGLSPQQTEVWRRSYKGMEIAEIAAELGISENQVSVQKHNAAKKLSDARKAAGF
jgi:RNA polymerase sigma factor (sigma-70 family)